MRKLIEAAHTEAWEILTEYRDVLDTLAGELLEKETLHRAELRGDLRRRQEAAADHRCSTTSAAAIPSDKPPIKTPGELAIERGEPWPKPVPEPAFKAAIAAGRAAARPPSGTTAPTARNGATAANGSSANGPTQPDYGAPAGWHAPGWPPPQPAAGPVPAAGLLVPAAAPPPPAGAPPPALSAVSALPAARPARRRTAGSPAPLGPTTRTRARNRTGPTRRPTADTERRLQMTRPHNNSAHVHHAAVFDQPRAEAAVRELLIAVGEDPDRHGSMDTPARVARAYKEMFAGLYTDPDDGAEHHVRRAARRTGAGQGDPDVLHLRAPPGGVPRRRPRRLHPRARTAG